VRSTELQRIGIIEGRKALGWERWRATINPYGLALLAAALRAAIEEGTIRPLDPDLLALLLLAALHEACAFVLSSEDRETASLEAAETLEALLDGLRVS
jgi:hypothetical protein